MKKGKLFFTPVDHEYRRIYGKYPDYDYIEMWHKHGAEYANKTINDRITKITQDMRKKHQTEEQKLLKECPFI